MNLRPLLSVALFVLGGFAVLFMILSVIVLVRGKPANAQTNRVPCWMVPNGANMTMTCANGYWYTITPDGETFSGNGQTDPSASARGSSITINPATGGPFVGAGTTVAPPTQILPMLEPHQAQQYGFQPRYD